VFDFSICFDKIKNQKRRDSTLEKPNFRIGMTSIEALVEIIRVNLKRGSPGFEGEFIWFYTYAPRKNTRDKKANSLSRLIFHDFSKSALIGCKSEDITVDSLNRWIGLLEEGSVLGIISDINIAFNLAEWYSPRRYHIPMMDFRCPKGLENLSRIKELLKAIGEEEGLILDSGRSYHYYGINPMSEKEWLAFLGSCLLSGLVDERYIGHRLKDRCGILRISACPLRPKIPTVVSILE
jgi:hypothetical protein